MAIVQHSLILHLPITPIQIEEYMRKQRPVYRYCPTITTPKPVGAEFKKQESDTLPKPYEGGVSYKTLLHGSSSPAPKANGTIRDVASDQNIFQIHLDWGKSTNLHCWWCCYPFNNKPCHIINRGTLEGCFCSPNCTLAYINVERNNERWRLVANLRQHLRKHMDVDKLIAAPPRQCLKIFGGNLTITEFRNNFIIPDKEQYLYFNHPYRPSVSFILKKKERDNKADKDNLVLRRTRKKYYNRNSLEMSMGLTTNVTATNVTATI